LIRLDCLGDAFKGCLKGQRPNLRKFETLLHFWNSRGLWAVARALKEDLCLFTDAIRYFAPAYIRDGLTLFFRYLYKGFLQLFASENLHPLRSSRHSFLPARCGSE
jgi:hypothetical protein